MKTTINNIIAILSLFAAVPTGWAIYAGTQKIPAFPMWFYASIAAGIAVVAVDVAAAMLVTDIRTFNQSLRLKGEQELFTMPTRQAWLILIGAVAAEIILGLVIVVIPSLLAGGVIVFPLLSLAGVFAFAVRADLQERESSLQELRAKKKQDVGTTKQPASKPTQTTTQSVEPAKVYDCTWPGCQWDTSKSKAVQQGGSPVSALAAHVSHHNRAVKKIEAEKEMAKVVSNE